MQIKKQMEQKTKAGAEASRNSLARCLPAFHHKLSLPSVNSSSSSSAQPFLTCLTPGLPPLRLHQFLFHLQINSYKSTSLSFHKKQSPPKSRREKKCRPSRLEAPEPESWKLPKRTVSAARLKKQVVKEWKPCAAEALATEGHKDVMSKRKINNQ
jgi:hypothetical protein